MIIGIDGNEANQSLRVGIGEYAYQVIRHIYQAQSSGDKILFQIYLKDMPREDLPRETSWWRYKIFQPKPLWTQIALPFHLFTEKIKPDVFYTPSHYSPRFSPCPAVVSIMDLSFIRYPELFLKKDLYQLKSWTAYSVKKAKKVLTISQYSKRTIVDYYKLSEDKVIVTYPGYAKNKFFPRKDNWRMRKKINQLRKKHHIDGDYILYVGTLQPRKNLIKLINAFGCIEKSERIKLVIVGKKGWLYDEIFEQVVIEKLEKEVIFIGFVDPLDLPDFYRGAKCFILPSLYEGFGIPVVEAMACGCPVIVSNTSSLPEIVGKAGILINPESSKDIAKGIVKILSLNEKKRRDMITRGIEQAKKFSWDKCAESTLKVLKEVSKENNNKYVDS